MKRKAQQLNPIAVCAFLVQADSNVIQLFPAGEFNAPRGSMRGSGIWKLNALIAAALIARVAQRKNPIPIDYEHQILSADQNGHPAPAAGWIDPQSLEWREGDGLYAAVKWTDRAKEFIKADEYRYISPVFPYSKSTGAVLDLLHASLVNVPAIDGMDSVSALAAAKFGLNQTHNEEPQMDELLKLFGLKSDASEVDVVAACKTMIQKNTDLQTDLTKKDEEIAAAKTSSPDPAKFAPVAVITELKAEVAALKSSNAVREIEDLVVPAIADGRIRGEANEKWARDLGKTDIAALKTFIDNAQPEAALKGNQTKGKKPAGLDAEGNLTDEAIAVCKQMGIDQADYKKTLEAESGI